MSWPAATIALALATCPAEAAELNFCWIGDNHYTMRGRIGFNDRHLDATLLTETDISSFEITGYEHGIAIGSWNMNDRDASTTWHLRFSPRDLIFPTGGHYPSDNAQGWNADGDVENCGRRGFGFNTGNYAQDICLFGVYVSQSSIAPDTPLRATIHPVTIDCRVEQQLS
ncbi:MAG: hypothetical protein JKX69_08550 [Rhodobacteraceae bacterium]|nr:hypothetical protein [Paracoccaceae bacterium]